MKRFSWKSWIWTVVTVFLFGTAAGLLGGNFEHYQLLNKPSYAPPGWLFGVVWPVLYVLMATALDRIRRVPPRAQRQGAILCFWVQLVLNTLWPLFFFRLEWRLAALILLIVLLAAVLCTTWQFARLDCVSAWLLVPYILWLLYALALNYSMYLLNR